MFAVFTSISKPYSPGLIDTPERDKRDSDLQVSSTVVS